MAEHEKKRMLDRFMDIACNPIGSLSLRTKLESDKRSLTLTFDLLSPCAATLTLSPFGYRIIECFLNANEDELNVGLSESLSGDWNELEQVMKTVNGRHVCETLLDRRMKTLAHNLITKVPREWWFNNVDSLPILLKTIQLCDIDVAKKFISTEQTEADLCNTAEGLYCVLKVRMKTKDEPGWRSSLKSLVLRKAKSIEGSEAIEQVIVYGSLMMEEIIEIVCRRESFDDSITVSLIIRLIEKSSLESRRIIFDCLCTPEGNPLFFQIRFSDRFDEFKKVCDAHFTPEQRQKLDDFLVERTVSSTVDECLNAANELYGQATGTSAIDEGKSRKRKMEMQPTHDKLKKKPAEEAVESTVAIESSAATALPQQPNGNSQGEVTNQIPPVSSVQIPKEVAVEEQKNSIREMFDEIDAVLKEGRWGLRQSTRYAKNFELTNLNRVESRQFFSQLLKERISKWAISDIGKHTLGIFANARKYRPALSDAIPPVLHLMNDTRGEKIVNYMLSSLTRADFIHYCLLGGASSPFANIFHSELPAEDCVKIGIKLTQVLPENVYTFLSRFGHSISATEKGRLFIERLKKPRPEGCGWTNLPNDLLSSLNSAAGDAETTARNQNVFCRDQLIAPTPPIRPIAHPIQNTPSAKEMPSTSYQKGIESSFTNFTNKPVSSFIPFAPSVAVPLPSFKSPLVVPSPSGLPSFPSFTRSSPRFSFSQSSSSPLSSAIIDGIVKERVESMVQTVVDSLSSASAVSDANSENRNDWHKQLRIPPAITTVLPAGTVANTVHTTASEKEKPSNSFRNGNKPTFTNFSKKSLSSPIIIPSQAAPLPFFKSPLVSSSPIGLPSFPSLARRINSPFSFHQSSRSPSFSSTILEHVVKETVEAMVKNVVDRNP